MNKQQTYNLEELKFFAKKLAKDLKPQSLILVDGPLGVGKTQLIRFMAEALDVSSQEIGSPSFSLLNLYQSPIGVLAHADFFRLKNKEDLESIAFWDAFNQSQFIFVEWPYKKDQNNSLIISRWPKYWKMISLSLEFCKDKNYRQVRYK